MSTFYPDNSANCSTDGVATDGIQRNKLIFPKEFDSDGLNPLKYKAIVVAAFVPMAGNPLNG